MDTIVGVLSDLLNEAVHVGDVVVAFLAVLVVGIVVGFVIDDFMRRK